MTTVHQSDVLTSMENMEAQRVYRRAFGPTKHLAMQRHMLTGEELDAIAANQHIAKWLARDERGYICGYSISIRDLSVWDLIEPAFFEHHWPDEYARGACFYIGFVCTAPGSPRDTFFRLIDAMMQPIREARGMNALDYSTVRVDRGLPQGSEKLIRACAPLLSADCVDAQHFYAYTYDWDSEAATA